MTMKDKIVRATYFPPYVIVEPDSSEEKPIVIDSPHSGRIYPGDFNSVAPFIRLRRAEDAYVDELVDFAPSLGATYLHALFPRSYVDVNRSLNHVNPEMLEGDWPFTIDNSFEPAARGLGLFWERVGLDTPLYNRSLSIEEALQRVHTFYDPYRKALNEILAQKLKKFGRVLYLDMHSMSADGSIAAEKTKVVRPDYYIGDKFHTSADQHFADFIEDFLKKRNRSVGVNGYFSGGDLLASHGKPEEGCHAIMIEINRGKYLNEVEVEKSDGFDVIRKELLELVTALASEI